MKEDLRNKTISGLKWSAIDRFSSQGISFVISIVIARILSPSDYGLIGLTAIFVGIPQIFISSGFGVALIKKQNRTETDFSTMFYYNIAISLLCYLLLFFTAPLIAGFFKEEQLTLIIRILSLNFVINSFQLVQYVKCRISLNFRLQAKISVISTFGSGVIGLCAAYFGWGVWALVIQNLSSAVFVTVLYILFIRWYPKASFSMESFKELFGYGSKLLLSSLLDTVFSNIYTFVIGKRFSVGDLGFYSRANSLAQLPSSNLMGILQNVTFPVLSKLQEDEEKMIAYHRKMIRATCFILFPVMGFIIVYAYPLIEVLLTEKWLPAAPLLQIVCVGLMFSPLQVLNANPLYLKSRTDLVLRLEIAKKIVVVIALLITIPLGIEAICIGSSAVAVVTFFLNIYYVKKVFPLSLKEQLKDIASVLVLVLTVCVISFCINRLFANSYVVLIGGGLFSLSLYLFLAKMLNYEELKMSIDMIKKR